MKPPSPTERQREALIHAREAYLFRYGGVKPEDVRNGLHDWKGFIKGYAAAMEDIIAQRDGAYG